MALQVTPSYGRDYKSKKAAQADWDANKDFTCSNGHTQINKQDATAPGSGVKAILLRFGQLRKVCQLRVGKASELDS